MSDSLGYGWTYGDETSFVFSKAVFDALKHFTCDENLKQAIHEGRANRVLELMGDYPLLSTDSFDYETISQMGISQLTQMQSGTRLRVAIETDLRPYKESGPERHVADIGAQVLRSAQLMDRIGG